MEDEIDLRPYINTLIKNWYVVVGVAIAFGILALILNLFPAPQYEANALIFVKSTDIIALDERIQDTSQTQLLRVLPELAVSDELLNNILAQLTLDNIKHVEQLRNILSITTGNDPSSIKLSVIYSDPEIVTKIAEIWANEFVTSANNIYFDSDGGQLQFYEDQLVEAELKLISAEEELISYQSINRTSVISNTLLAYNQRHLNFLEAQQDLEFLQQDIKAYLASMTTPSTQRRLSFDNQYMALSLQLRFINSEAAVPILLQPAETNAFSTETLTEQIAILESMLAISEEQSQKLAEEIIDIESEIIGLQQQLEMAETEYLRLIRGVEVAENTYSILASKVQEENITSRNTGDGVRLVSRPIVPSKPIGPQTLINVLLSFFLGLISGIFALIIKQWWQIYNQN